jgi:iron complex outermembrane receptor protein
MKFIFLLVAGLTCMNAVASILDVPYVGKTSLKGKIIDKETGEPLIGVNIYIPDLKTGTITNIDGTYFLDNLPQTKILLQVNYLGYETIVENIDLTTTTTMDPP